MRARFRGTSLALQLALTRGAASHFTVVIDDKRYPLSLLRPGVTEWQLNEDLEPGEHTLQLIKRTEGLMGEAVLLGLRTSTDGQWLAPPPERPRRLVFYGDSITAGACNGDLGDDQYEDLSSHDGSRAYGALTAERLGADYEGIAVSGIGLTASWNDLLMPQVWNRTAPRRDAAEAPKERRAPDVVLVNLGQNDHGFPASQGRAMAADFAAHYLAFVRLLRARDPQARLVLLIGGMAAWREEPRLWEALRQAADQLAREGDTRVWTYRFEATASAHPRIDVHAQMAEELVHFLTTQVLPATPPPRP